MTATRALVLVLSLTCAFLLGREFARRGAERELPGPGYAVQVAGATRAAQLLGDSRALPSTTFVEVAERLRPSVVSIRGTSERVYSTGSGVIVSADGAVLTNYHVVEDCTTIHVTLSSGDPYRARLVGKDQPTDLALLRIDGVKGLLPATFGDSDAVRVGEDNIAMGNPIGFGWTVTKGIISSLHRNEIELPGDVGLRIGRYTDFIQTDAAINPGNSGGPIVNARGEVIGISTAILSRPSEGIGFAIPSNDARFVANELIQHGGVRRGYLGLQGKDLNPEVRRVVAPGATGGAVVTQVTPNTPAEKSGLQLHDVIVAIDGWNVESFATLRNRIARIPPATEVSLKVFRNGREQDMRAVIGEFPDQDG